MSVITNSAANCSDSVLLPYTAISPARKLTTTITAGRTAYGVATATIKVTSVVSSTHASSSLNLCRSGLGRSIWLVHSAPIDTTIAPCRSIASRASSVRPITPVAVRTPRET